MTPGPQALPPMGEIIPGCRVALVLPFDIAFALVEAARIQLSEPPGESAKRTAKIDAVVKQAKAHNPHLFQE